VGGWGSGNNVCSHYIQVVFSNHGIRRYISSKKGEGGGGKEATVSLNCYLTNIDFLKTFFISNGIKILLDKVSLL